MVLTALLFKPSTRSFLGHNSDHQRRIRACFAMPKGHAARTVKHFTYRSWLNGGVAIERFAVQPLVLLVQRFLFPVFVQQHNAILLVAVTILQARQGKERQGRTIQALFCTNMHDTRCYAHGAHMLADTEKGARQNKMRHPTLNTWY